MSDPLAHHRQAYAYCAYCPKVCRFACPVSESTHNETTSTWGKMTSAFLSTQGERPLDEGSARALYACTGCMRCRSFCAHQNEVGYALFSARSVAVEEKVAPEGAHATLATFAEHQNPFGKDLNQVLAGYRTEAPVRFQLFPGCSALVKRPKAVADALEVAEGFGAPMGVSRASARCCGYPLYAAGDQRAFREHAERFAQSLAQYPEIVVLDPGCAYTMKVVYPRVGVNVPSAVRTLYEVLDERLPQVAERPRLREPVAYQDACHLGRGLGQYDEPRRLLAAAVESVREAFENRAEAGCSGGGGLLPRTMGDTSVDIARRQAARVAPDGETVVTTCPTSVRMFERGGAKAKDLVSVLREWLGGAR